MAREFLPAIQDTMILLASGQYLINQIALLGFSYSIIQRSITLKKTRNEIFTLSSSAMFVGIPINLLGAYFLGLYLELNTIEMGLYITASLISFILEIFIIINNTFLDADKAVISIALYSVFNSILVPISYLVNPSLSSVLIAWILAYFISIFYNRKNLRTLISIKSFDFISLKSLIRFGFPVYLSNIYTVLIGKLDVFLLYELFDEGTTSQYFWVLRIATVIQEIFYVILTGLSPLLMSIFRDNKYDIFLKRVSTMLRISMLFGTIYFSLGIFHAQTLIFVILSDAYLSGLILLKLALLSFYFEIPGRLLQQVIGAEGGRKRLLFGRVFTGSVRIIFILILSKYAGVGLIFSLLLSKIFESVYFIYYRKFRLKSLFQDKKNRLLHVGLIFIAFVPLIWHSLAEFIMLLILSILVILFFIILVRPLLKEDWRLIERIIPNNKISEKIMSILKSNLVK